MVDQYIVFRYTCYIDSGLQIRTFYLDWNVL